MSYLPYTNLGCYYRDENNRAVTGGPVVNWPGRNGYNGRDLFDQKQCYDVAQKRGFKYFALQGRDSHYGNCEVGNELNVRPTDESECSNICNFPGKTDTTFEKMNLPGCGSTGRHGSLRPWSVYEVHQGQTPKIVLDKTSAFNDNNELGELYKNGDYSFKDSSHSWKFSGKNAFDGNGKSMWITPFVHPNQRYQKNYDSNPYVVKDRSNAFKASYRTSDGNTVRNRYFNVDGRPLQPHKDGKRGAPIVHETSEMNKDPENTDFVPNKHQGEWVEISFPYKFKPKSLELKGARELPHIAYLKCFPRNFVLLAKNDEDGLDGWEKISEYNGHDKINELINIYRQSPRHYRRNTNYEQKRKEAFTYPITSEKPYSTYRIVIKETYGHTVACLGSVVIKGDICIDMGGNCSEFNAVDKTTTEGFSNMNNDINNYLLEDNFSNMSNDLIKESFTNPNIENEFKQPLNEKNVFNIGYSKY